MIATRESLASDLAELGLASGDTVMVHAAFSRVGVVLGGPDALVDAFEDVIGPRGTIVSYQDWEVGLDIWDSGGAVPDHLKPHVPPFDPLNARPSRDHGILAAIIGTRRGVRRSRNPGAAVAAIGSRSEELTRDHPLDDGYGFGSPFAALVAVGGKVAMIGAPLDTMTLLHHAEAIAHVPGKKGVRREYPLLAEDGSTHWTWIEEFDTADPVVDGLPGDYFATVVEDFLATGSGRRGYVGDADSVVVDADAVTEFAIEWLERFATG